ncbi:MAG: hypothetical protein MUP67_08725 [Acidimicrobiia bacterium]|nr:hypothetical protein [Acidimicrobiia bacterium]
MLLPVRRLGLHLRRTRVNNVDPDGGNDSTSALTLTAGQTDLNQNFGYAVPVTVTEPPVATSTGFLPFTGASMVGQLAMLGTILASVGLGFVMLSRRREGLLARLRSRSTS